jgi:hypothetical protein
VAPQIGAVLDDKALLAGGDAPTGTITFTLYGPGDETCSTAIYTSTVSVSGNGEYFASSGSETGSREATAVGVFRWTASYSGDDRNEPAGSGCSEELVVVAKKVPTVLATAIPTTAEVGSTLNALAAVWFGHQPTGRVAFRLYGPNDTTCSGLPAHEEEADVDPNASNGTSAYTSTGFAVPSEGTWRWKATYVGDANNEEASSSCHEAPVSVVKKTEKPPKDPGGEPFSTNVYFDCVDDHNIGVPYGHRLVLRFGFGTLTEKQIREFLRGTSTRASVEGIAVQHAETYWSKPALETRPPGSDPSELWISRWIYDTGRVVTESSQRFAVEFELVATQTVTDGVDTWNPGDVVVSSGGPCMVWGRTP